VPFSAHADRIELNALHKVARAHRKEYFSASATATFQPDCKPPMTVVFQNVMVTVTASDGTFLTYTFPGTL
jgi:hypothetical protein